MIDGVEVRDLQMNADERGHLVEMFREDWPEYDPEQAMLVNFPTNLYDYADPDEEQLPPHTDEIPLDWDEQPH